MKKVTQSYVFILSFLCLSLPLFSTQILVQGKIIDSQSKQAIGVNIEFKDTNGKKIKTQSNSQTGEFQQILESNTIYNVVLMSNDILRKEVKFHTLDTNSYAEQKVNFNVIKPIVGSIILDDNLFENNSNTLSNDSKDKLEELQLLLRFNRNLNVDIKVSSKNKDLMASRLEVLKNYINNWKRENPRITINVGNTNSDNILVQISTIKDFLKE
ncbi:MAG TPA: hypothetical protein PLE30_00540 [Candidatus Kapabacteria bacterium]|nr:hypothetical protein [Candidatus Kapabacteria bacterium]